MNSFQGSRKVQFTPKKDRMTGYLIDSISISSDGASAILSVNSGDKQVRCWPYKTVQIAMAEAENEYGVSPEAWTKLENKQNEAASKIFGYVIGAADRAAESVAENNGQKAIFCRALRACIDVMKDDSPLGLHGASFRIGLNKGYNDNPLSS